jgi:predicted alpha/beta-hydrolase family hydrolase
MVFDNLVLLTATSEQPMAQPKTAAHWPIQVGDAQTTAIFEPALQSDADTLFIFAHGAGGHRDDRGMLALSEQLRGRGLHVVRFNFPLPRTRQQPPRCRCRASSNALSRLSHALAERFNRSA